MCVCVCVCVCMCLCVCVCECLCVCVCLCLCLCVCVCQYPSHPFRPLPSPQLSTLAIGSQSPIPCPLPRPPSHRNIIDHIDLYPNNDLNHTLRAGNISGLSGLLFLRAPYKLQFYLLTYLLSPNRPFLVACSFAVISLPCPLSVSSTSPARVLY